MVVLEKVIHNKVTYTKGCREDHHCHGHGQLLEIASEVALTSSVITNVVILDKDHVYSLTTALAKARFYAMFWKLGCRSFIRLIGGFIFLRGGVIYIYADTDVYIVNINIASNCIFIKIMEAAS